MHLVPIKRTLEENTEFIDNPACTETLMMCVEFYKRIGYQPPWICYFAEENNEIIGSAAFKGRPINNTVEIAYSTMDNHRQKGIGTRICKLLVELSRATDPSLRITARTLPEHNYSTKILEKNNFNLLGIVNDPDDGDVWEWEYKKI
ncbi:MAG TPA: GNAT family protein [Chitinophagaceae bacterium]|nr:GNAT family protein [Chitinophagaceae bacterium]